PRPRAMPSIVRCSRMAGRYRTQRQLVRQQGEFFFTLSDPYVRWLRSIVLPCCARTGALFPLGSKQKNSWSYARMKILLQHTGSGLFYKGLGIWVPDEIDARVFVSALDAIEFCQQQGLSSVEIVLRSE